MKFTNIKKLIIKFMGGGIINFPTKFLRWVKIEGDIDDSDDGGGSGGGEVEMIRINKEAFPVNDQDILLNTVDKQKGYTLEEIFDKGADVVQMLVDLFKANAPITSPVNEWLNNISMSLGYEGEWGVKDWGKPEFPELQITRVYENGQYYNNKPSLNLSSTSPGGSAPSIQIYFKEGADGKWYMYDGWSVTAS